MSVTNCLNTLNTPQQRNTYLQMYERQTKYQYIYCGPIEWTNDAAATGNKQSTGGARNNQEYN